VKHSFEKPFGMLAPALGSTLYFPLVYLAALPLQLTLLNYGDPVIMVISNEPVVAVK
jgi:hypothetical protein